MAATLPQMIRFQPLFGGVCIPGGKVYFYVAGTSTPLPVYASDGTTPLTSPVILDANGSADFRLGSGLSYKINVLNSSDVQMSGWPVDNVQALDFYSITVQTTVFTDLASYSNVAKGDALVGVLAPYTGAIPRTQHQINAEFLSLKSFGAVGNGIADDYAAIQSAIDAYGFIYMPPGTYYISHGLIAHRSIRILAGGQSAEAAIVRNYSGSGPTDGMLVLPPDSVGSYIDGVNFYTLSGQTGGSIIYGYATVSASNGLTTFNNCRFGTTGTDTHDYTIFIDGTAKNTGAIGFRLISFTNCSIFGARVATIEFRGVVHFNVSGGQVPAAGGTGSIIRFTGVSGVETQNGIFNPGDTNCDIYFDYAQYIICDSSIMGQIYNTVNSLYNIVRGHSAFGCQNNWINSRFDCTNPCGAHAFPGGNLENVTGDGTEYFPVFNGQLFDLDISYNTTTGRLTSKQPGIYLIHFCCMCNGILSTHTKYDLFIYRYSSANVLLQTYKKTGNAYMLGNSDTQASIEFETTLQMDAGDYLRPSITVYNGTLVIDIYATSLRQSFFQATKIR